MLTISDIVYFIHSALGLVIEGHKIKSQSVLPDAGVLLITIANGDKFRVTVDKVN